MDMTTCVGRRTRSRTESYLNDLLNQSKGVSVADQSKSTTGRREKKRAPLPSPLPLRDSCSPEKSKRRRKRKSKDDDDVEFVGTIYPKGKREKEHVVVVEDDNVGSPLVIALSSESDRACGVTVDDAMGDDDGDVEFVRTIYPEDVDSSDYTEKISDSSYYAESSDSGEDDEFGGARDTATVKKKSPSERVYKRKTSYRKNDLDVSDLLAKSIWQRKKIVEEDISFEDETAEVDTREDPTVRERSSEKVHEQRKRKRFHMEKKKNRSNVFDLLGDSFDSFDVGENPWVSSPINLRFGCEEPEPVEKTEEEKEVDRLWQDMALALSLEGLHSSTYFKVRRLFDLLFCPMIMLSL